MSISNDVDVDVVVVGAGPVGLWLAAELSLAGASVMVLDKRPNRSEHSRALTVHARTLETFALRGVVGPWLAEGITIPTTHYAMLSTRLDLRGLDSDYPFTLAIPQKRTEEFIEEYARGLGVPIRRGEEAVAFTETPDGVTVRAVEGASGRRTTYSGRYLVGCDGRRSTVRTQAGIGYTGSEGTVGCLLGDVRLTDPTVGAAVSMQTGTGSFYAVRITAERYRLIGIEPDAAPVARDTPATLEELRQSILRITGSDYGMHDPVWVTRLGSATFQADEYRRGRVMLAGDAAHVHFPMGGQGMNLGIQDAMNLGWKLGMVVRRAAPPSLLDSYHAERSPIGQLVISDTLAQTALVGVSGAEGMALRAMMNTALADNPRLNTTLGTFASGVDVRYPAGPGDHPLVGSRVPNLHLDDGTGVFELLHRGLTTVLGMSGDRLREHLGAAADDVTATAATVTGRTDAWGELGAAIVRPDGYLAWAADTSQPGAPASEVASALRGWLSGLVTT